MRHIGICVIALCLAAPAASEQPPAKAVSLSSAFTPGEISRYNVDVQVTGTTKLPGASQPSSVEAVLSLEVTHTVGQRAEDGSMQLYIAAAHPSAIIGGQKVALTKDVFPQLIALFDSSGDVTRLYAPDAMAVRLPGITYRSMLILFRPYAPAGDLKPGATWKKALILPPETEKYDLSCTLEALEDIGGVHTARVRTDVTVFPGAPMDYAAKGFAVTHFSLDGGLLKSRAEMVIKTSSSGPESPTETPGPDTPGQVEIVVKINIHRADLALSAK